MTFESELERVAGQYRSEGYTVALHPEAPASGVKADLLAVRGGETVVVRVLRSRAAFETDPTIPRQADAVNARSGWRYDLVVLEKDTTERGVAVEPTEEQFRGMLARARRAAAAGFEELALTDACATLEAAMRRAEGGGGGMHARPARPTELLNGLYANGRISRREFDRARLAWAIRSQTVHGFVTPAIDPTLIDDVLNLTDRLRGSASNDNGAAA